MPKDILSEIRDNLPSEGQRNKYTRKAFRLLPKLQKPRILDIGCGSGAPTMELARLSGGEIIGIDIDQPSLDKLKAKIEEAGLSQRIKTMNRSMFDMDFPDESFDIIWAEGSIWIVGFERGLREWRRLLKPHGLLVVHEMVWLRPNTPKEVCDYWRQFYSGIKTVTENMELVPRCGYDLIGHFALPEKAWWISYYRPLEKRIAEFRAKYTGDPNAIAVLDGQQHETDMYKNSHKWYGSAFFVMSRAIAATSFSKQLGGQDRSLHRSIG